MKLSTRSTYGMRAMLALGREYGQRTLMVKEIAEQENLPATYLEQIMVPLRKAKLLQATRGAHGGYTLARAPQEITLAEILEALEGPFALADCPSGAGCCGHPEACALHDLWNDASDMLRGYFARITLASLIERQRAKEAVPVLMYSI